MPRCKRDQWAEESAGADNVPMQSSPIPTWQPMTSCGNVGSVPQVPAERIQCTGLRPVRFSMSLRDATSSQAPFRECGTSPPFPRDFGYARAPFLSHARAHWIVLRERGWEKDTDFSGVSLTWGRQRGRSRREHSCGLLLTECPG